MKQKEFGRRKRPLNLISPFKPNSVLLIRRILLPSKIDGINATFCYWITHFS